MMTRSFGTGMATLHELAFFFTTFPNLLEWGIFPSLLCQITSPLQREKTEKREELAIQLGKFGTGLMPV